MARPLLVCLLVSCSTLVPPNAFGGFRVDVMGWDPFAQKTTGWELGLEVYSTRDVAERHQRIAEHWEIVKLVRIVEVEHAPPAVKLPAEFSPPLPILDEDGNPIPSETSPIKTLVQYRALIDKLYFNAAEAKNWAMTKPNKLDGKTFNKVNAIVEQYNRAIAKANKGPHAPYARLEPLTPQVVLAARTRQMLEEYQDGHNRFLNEMSDELSQLRDERKVLLDKQAKLKQQRSAIAKEETELAKSFDEMLSEIMKQFQKVDAVLAKKPSKEELIALGIEQQLESLRTQRKTIERENTAAKLELKSRYETWKKNYGTLAAGFNDFNRRSQRVKVSLAEHQAQVAKASEQFLQMRESVRTFFENQHAYSTGRSRNEAVNRLLGGP